MNEDADTPTLYQIKIKGQLDDRWKDWFEDLTITLTEDGNTMLSGVIVDQAALHGVFRRALNVGLTIISVLPTEDRNEVINAEDPERGREFAEENIRDESTIRDHNRKTDGDSKAIGHDQSLKNSASRRKFMLRKNVAHNNEQQINAPFRAKSAGVSLVAILTIGMYYFVNVLDLLPAEDGVPDGALALAITAVVLIIIIESALQIVLFIGAGKVEAYNECDEAISVKSSRNAYFILTIGVFATFASAFVGVTPYVMGNIILLFFLLAEMVKFGSQLLYYRRSA